MKRIKEFICDDFCIPTDEELLECKNVAISENCHVRLHYTPPLGHMHTIGIDAYTDIEEIKKYYNII